MQRPWVFQQVGSQGVMAKMKRMSGDDRLATILEAGAKLVGKLGAKNVTRKDVAKEAKVSPALVAYYMGSSAEAQKAYAKHARKLGIAQPPKEEIERIGAKMRAHGPRKSKVVRKRSDKEKAAIKRKVSRSAKSGEFVSKATAKANPATTVTETVKPARKRPAPG